MNIKSKLLDFAIIVMCIICVLIGFATLQEAAEAKAKVEWSERITTQPDVSYFAPHDEVDSVEPIVIEPVFDIGVEPVAENPNEDAMIEAGLIEIGYYRDDVPLTYEEQDYLQTACNEFNIRYPLALAVIEHETGFQNVIGDHGNSIGYFQVQPRWCGALMDEIGVSDLTEPHQNFRTGCAILRMWLDKYGNERDALTAFNTGHAGYSVYAKTVLEKAEMWT